MQGIKVDAEGTALDQEDLMWDGQTAVIKPISGNLEIDSTGELHSGPIKLALEQQGMEFTYQEAGWE